MLITMKLSRPYLRTALHSAAIISARSFSTFQLSNNFRQSSLRNSHCAHSSITQVSLWNKSKCQIERFGLSQPTSLLSSKAEVEEDIISDKGGDGQSSSEEQEFASSYHAPVMYKECIDALLKRSHNNTKKRNKYKKQAKVDENINFIEEDANRPSHRIFIDGTLGGGGHSLCLLQNLSPGDVLVGCDVDPSALATASTRLKDYIVDQNTEYTGGPIFLPVQSNFRDLETNMKDMIHPITGELLLYSKDTCSDLDKDDSIFVGVDGILLDLGISSHQIDNADRGFAFMKDGPLDMRLWGGEWENQAVAVANESKERAGGDENENKDYAFVKNKNDENGGMNAADICNEFTEEEISRILKVYGDEPRSRKIAQSIVMARPLETTGDLKEAVAMVTPEFARKGRRMGRTATLARVFQALRIVVNDEDIVLRDALEDMAPALIRKGGRLVVLAYHSMEDRAAKRVMRDGSVRGSRQGPKRDIYGNEIFSVDGENLRPWKALGKAQKATQEEIEVNPRARSATLRVGEKT